MAFIDDVSHKLHKIACWGMAEWWGITVYIWCSALSIYCVSLFGRKSATVMAGKIVVSWRRNKVTAPLYHDVITWKRLPCFGFCAGNPLDSWTCWINSQVIGDVRHINAHVTPLWWNALTKTLLRHKKTSFGLMKNPKFRIPQQKKYMGIKQSLHSESTPYHLP